MHHHGFAKSCFSVKSNEFLLREHTIVNVAVQVPVRVGIADPHDQGLLEMRPVAVARLPQPFLGHSLTGTNKIEDQVSS